MQKHSLFSQDQNIHIAFFEIFDKDAIKTEIINHLTKYPDDVIEHLKEYSKSDLKKYYGSEIIGLYCNNNGKVYKIITKGNKEYYKPLTID